MFLLTIPSAWAKTARLISRRTSGRLAFLAGFVRRQPADAQETAEAWRLALTRRQGPTALILSPPKPAAH
jgi:hypothetical protein